MDPFESEKIHSGTTGLVENWRLKLTRTPEWSQSLGSSMVITPTPTPRPRPTPTPRKKPSPYSNASTLICTFDILSFFLYLPLTSCVIPRLRILAFCSQFRRALVLKELSQALRIFPSISARIFATRSSASSSGMSSIPTNRGLTPVSQSFNVYSTILTLLSLRVCGLTMQFSTR